MTKRTFAIEENKIDASKNSAQNLDYYDKLVKFFDEDSASTLLKLRSFGLYSPRQVITDFLVRYELFKMIADVPGSVFELGVFNGQGLLTYAHVSSILEPNNIGRRIFGFDTFSGFPSIDEKDKKGRSSFVQAGGYGVDSFNRITEAIKLFDANRFIGHVPKIELIKGDVCETLPRFLNENAHVIPSLIHLDMDIHRPTKIALDLLLPKMPKGAVVVFDELNVKDFPGETIAFMEVLPTNSVALKRMPFCSRISYFVV
jgi:hypothetical protein